MTVNEGSVRGILDGPENGDGIVLAHGAGSDCKAAVLASAAAAFAGAGFAVLRIDLPFRQTRPHGPPSPAGAARDREGIAEAAALLRGRIPGRVFLGGHSYGGRQSSMLAADNPDSAAGLLLLSYPLHPPRRPSDLRTAHLPRLRVPSLFIQGTRDPFGSPAEMEQAIALIPAPSRLLLVPGGHDLASISARWGEVLEGFRALASV